MIALRPLAPQDFQFVKDLYEDPGMCEYFRNAPPLMVWNSPETMMQLFTVSYVVTEDELPIGMINLVNPDAINKHVEFGLMLNCANRQDVAIEATKQLGAYVFEYLGYNKLSCKVLEHRTNLMQLLARFKFSIEGRLRQHTYYNGEFHDEIVLSLLAQDYRSVV